MPTSASSSAPRRTAAGVSMPRCACRVSTICVPTVSTGLSDVIGSWKTTASSGPRRRRSASAASPRDRGHRTSPGRKAWPAWAAAAGWRATAWSCRSPIRRRRPACCLPRRRDRHCRPRLQRAARRRQARPTRPRSKAKGATAGRALTAPPGRGSVSARSVSPTTLKDSTVRNITAAGMKASHGAMSRLSRPSPIMLPQLGAGGGTPSPRKRQRALDDDGDGDAEQEEGDQRQRHVGQQLAQQDARCAWRRAPARR